MLLLGAVPVDGQAPADRPWRTRWSAGLESSFDDNPFKLTSGQRADVPDGGDRWASLKQPYDVTNVLQLGLNANGRGLKGRKLELESDVRLDVYAINQRRTSVELGLQATQSLSKRAGLHLELDLRPSEFRRNYLSAGGIYEAGVATTLDAALSYQRELLKGKGQRPDVGVELGVLAARRTYKDMPWRDRNQFGLALAADLKAGPIAVELTTAGLRAFDNYDGAEPVSLNGAVVMTPLQRGFDELRVGLETVARTGKHTRVGVEYGLRQRNYTATEQEDPAHSGRVDRRHGFGGNVRWEAAKRIELIAGAEHQVQTTFRPGNGDTGDETDYKRTRISVRVEYRR
ncbi:MAG TPA: hypothetical protein VK864_06285 [Longimicrobiales bacterium]|nr:hypothetical protein [Longimicrobiales bacterium]